MRFVNALLKFPHLSTIAIGVLVCAVSLPNGFFFDDHLLLVDNQWLHGTRAPWFWFKSGFIDSSFLFDGYRPLLMNSFLLNVNLLGPEAWSLRLGNIALHIINTLLLIHIFKKLIGSERGGVLAFFAGLLFLLHPVQTVGINFLWKRSTLLATTFILSMLLVHIKERQRGHYRWTVLGLQILLFICAFTSKESGVIAPCFLLCFDLFNKHVFKNKRTWILFVTLFALGAFFTWFRVEYLSEHLQRVQFSFPNHRTVGREHYFFSQLANLPKYVGLMVVPRPLMLDDPTPLNTLPIFGTLASLALLLASIWAIVRFRNNVAVVISIAFFWVGLLPTMGIMPMYLNMDQIRLYLPLAGFCFLLAATVDHLMLKTRWQPAALMLFIAILYAGSSLQQHLHYRQPANVWYEISQKYPHSEIALSLLGDAFVRERNYAAAIEVFGQSALIRSNDPNQKLKQLVLRLQVGEDKETVLEELSAIDRSQLGVRSRLNLGNAYALAKKFKEAEAIYLDIISRKPSYTNAHLNLGSVWEESGDFQRARLAFKNVLLLAPQHKFAKKRLKFVEEQLAKQEKAGEQPSPD